MSKLAHPHTNLLSSPFLSLPPSRPSSPPPLSTFPPLSHFLSPPQQPLSCSAPPSRIHIFVGPELVSRPPLPSLSPIALALVAMVKFSCFGADPDGYENENENENDIQSHHSADSDNHPAGRVDRLKRQVMFPNKRVLTREAAKQRLKKIINVRKDHQHDKERPIDDDPEFFILAKIYSELDATVDLNSITRNRFTLSHLLPFLLNALLYGFDDRLGSVRGGSSRSGKKSSALRVPRDPKLITLGGTTNLVKAQCERQLEQFLYQQAMHSVSFALECLWYFTGSLYLGPKETYHRTMTLLLGMESVVTNSSPPGDLFKKAQVKETTPNSEPAGSSSSSPDSSDRPEKIPLDVPRPQPVRQVDLDITGSGENDHRMHFHTPLKVDDQEKLQHWLDARRERATTFHASLDFVNCLTRISNGLFDVEREYRRDVLRRELEKLNEHIPTNVSIPTERRPHRVLRIVPEDAHVFSTKERVPYLLVVEVEDLSPPVQDRPHPSDDHRLTSPLRRIGSIGAPVGSQRHTGGPSTLSTLAPDDDDAVQLQNQPESKFTFSPDVTAEANSMAGSLLKRESSFRVDVQHADDRRPPDEELLKALGEPWAVKSDRLRRTSPHGSNPHWRLVSCIVKARDQLRQEMFAQRLIQEFARIFERGSVPVFLRAYQIISTSSDSGLIETLTDAISIDSIKKHSPNVVTLQDYFVGRFGGRGSHGYKRAVRNFVQSMAGYSVVQYLLNIKDRHNGNLMLDADGHVIHIDFGFLLSNSPGGNMEFEKAPFKLTNEMVQVMGGSKSGAFKQFKKLCVQAYLEACRYANKLLLMVDIAYPGNESMPCFLQGREYVLENLRDRFGVDLTRKERAARMMKLIATAHGNWTTKAYDQYQRVSLGIAK